jgi:SAM-dependent methyltransferase
MVATDISRVKYHGLESGRTMIEGHGPYFERVVSEMERLPFADQSFDGLLIYAALHHSNDMPATLREAHRVLRPGGAALVIHEGVSGILRNNRLIGLRSVHEIDWQQFNWNEQTFWLHQYAGAARRAGLRTQLLIAPFIENRLERGDFGGLLFGRIGRLAARLWRLPGGHRLLRSQASIWAASYLVGMPLTAIFRRPR